MTDGYSLDTNIIIDARNRWYPPELFPGLWQNIERLIAAGRAIVTREVAEELVRGDDDCAAWATSFPGFVAEADEVIVGVVTRIVSDFPAWSSVNTNWADPFVIAHGETRGFVVVTHERWSNSSVLGQEKIPNVCARYGLPCIGLTDLISEEGWSF